jgi:GH25 family lysozyme M1 (1,4-beta-N-acetylmuramidase)
MVTTITARAHGIDISKWDLKFNPDLATKQLDFVVQRASYRTTKDEAFDALYPGVQKVPRRLAYHYLNSDASAEAQFNTFMSVVNGKGFHAYVCDFESDFNVMSPTFAKMAWDFCKKVVVATGKRCLLYTGFYQYRDYLVPSQKQYNIDWNLVDLWIAQYHNVVDPNGTPNLPPGRTTGWSMWQYTNNGNGTEYGAGRSTACDLNVFNGSTADMDTFLGITTTPPPATPVYPKADFALKVNGVTYSAKDVELKPE